jgi:hypothetical protein
LHVAGDAGGGNDAVVGVVGVHGGRRLTPQTSDAKSYRRG